ncbi:ulp1 protease family protein [Colletotrichum tofieldiae]|nr:Ulp1 protease family protein [Colletotrichum tofieldiae]GKT82042.1 ulp1 protease family protein [Colletotrichum tofieldiae]
MGDIKLNDAAFQALMQAAACVLPLHPLNNHSALAFFLCLDRQDVVAVDQYDLVRSEASTEAAQRLLGNFCRAYLSVCAASRHYVTVLEAKDPQVDMQQCT